APAPPRLADALPSSAPRRPHPTLSRPAGERPKGNKKMALRHFNPASPTQRQLVIADRSSLHKGKPVKALTEGLSSKGGRNNMGRMTVRFRGGGHKRTYRLIDFKR